MVIEGYFGRKNDQGKLRWSLVPWDGLEGVVKVLDYGAAKYAPQSWRLVPDARERYTDALLRHQTAILRGEHLDLESGLPHSYHVACNSLFLAELDALEMKRPQLQTEPGPNRDW
jgi:hypothetical protein